jgi:gliding motility-associated-like protein
MFRVRGGPFESLDFRIFNEWGNEVFMTNSQADGWDGTHNNNQQPAGKYIWVVKGTYPNGDGFKLMGQFMLIK